MKANSNITPIKKITIRGARQHNLQNIDLDIPHNSLVVITGPSGSGKSSLAFDTLYAEGQRRYIESLSTYARQFLQQMNRPDVDLVDGLSPAIAIENKHISKNPRSTVGTITEIYDYLRLLFSRVSEAHCPKCNRLIRTIHPEQVVDEVLRLPEGTRIIILSPLFISKTTDRGKLIKRLEKDGFIRVRIDGKIFEISRIPRKVLITSNRLDIVIDRLVVKQEKRKRLADSIELAFGKGKGRINILEASGREHFFTERHVCDFCDVELPKPSPKLFSFNNTEGACQQCGGLGFEEAFDPDLLVPDPALSLREGAIIPWANRTNVFFFEQLESLAKHYHFDLNTAFKDLPRKVKHILLYGSGDEQIPFFNDSDNGRIVRKKPFLGVIPRLTQKLFESKTPEEKREIKQFMRRKACSLCKGSRLRREALTFTFRGYTIFDIVSMSITDSYEWFESVTPLFQDNPVATRILEEINKRLELLKKIGLHYLTLQRPANTLSGGETQRIRLANQIGSRLVGVLYILDEPTVGLHPSDQKKLLNTLVSLKNLGNTVLVVEHDPETIMNADYVIDMGPGAGAKGGKIIFQGTPEQLTKHPYSLTGKYLRDSSKTRSSPIPRPATNGYLMLRGASSFNLKNVEMKIPLGLFTCITGVSGSGKTTLLYHTLYKALAKHYYNANTNPGQFDTIDGLEMLDGVILADQGPIGKSPRSNPATYIGLFSIIRQLFSRLPDSRTRGYSSSRFSFNLKGGRCESCKGNGQLRIQLHFLPDIYITCPACKGRRYNRETLEIRYKGKNISDVLDITVNEAIEHFANLPILRNKLLVLQEVGLGYLKIGQPANTLSAGESQRVKLAKQLSRRPEAKILYILDEPTTGLHMDDMTKLLMVLEKLVEKGNTVVAIEHNLDFIKQADWIIDLGPGGGSAGGQIVATGPPKSIARQEDSLTGRYLKRKLSL